MPEPWHPDETEGERAARNAAYQRLLAAARGAGLSAERLAGLLRQLAHNETETRRLLTEVYGVPDDLLDDVLRVHMEEPPSEGEGG